MECLDSVPVGKHRRPLRFVYWYIVLSAITGVILSPEFRRKMLTYNGKSDKMVDSRKGSVGFVPSGQNN